MNKDKVLFYLHRTRKRFELLSQEDMARAGIEYPERRRIEMQREELKEEDEAVSIAEELIRNARSDNLVFKD